LLSLDRVELADIYNPELLVEAIFNQLPNISIPIPIEQLAKANDIEEINKLEGLPTFVGMLATDETKNFGQIWVGSEMRITRQRFTIAHEFGHFLLPHHKKMKYECTSRDMSQNEGGITPEASKEWEANRFAAELMLPKSHFVKRLGKVSAPCLSHVQRLADIFEMSIEATCRRYLTLSGFSCCLVFTKDGRLIKYPAKSVDFHYWVMLKPNQEVSKNSTAFLKGTGLSEIMEISAYEWLNPTKHMPEVIQEQTLYQEDGYAITLLWVESLDDDIY